MLSDGGFVVVVGKNVDDAVADVDVEVLLMVAVMVVAAAADVVVDVAMTLVELFDVAFDGLVVVHLMVPY